MDQKYIVALELSGTQIKGAVATLGTSANGVPAGPTIEAIAVEENTDCVQYGRVQNLLNAAKSTKYVIQRLEGDPALGGGHISGAYIGLSGRSLGSEQTTAEITLPEETIIDEKIIRDLYVAASKMVSQNRKVLRVLPRKFVVDNQTMYPVGALGRKLRGDFTLVTCNPTHQRNTDLVFSEGHVGLPILGYIVTPLAMADMLLDEEEKQLGCVLVDIGHQTTTISIYKDRALQYLATLPMGSYNITRDITVGLNLTLEKAEALKFSHGDAMPKDSRSNDETSRINSYVAARAYEIVANINANIGYARYKTADLPAGFILTGRGSRLKNFDTLLSTQTKMRVRSASMPSNVKFALNTNNIRPQDYLSLVSLVMRAARMPKLASCVAFESDNNGEIDEAIFSDPNLTTPEQKTTEIKQPVTPKPAPEQPATTVTPQPAVTETKPEQPKTPSYYEEQQRNDRYQVDDSKWDSDDDDPNNKKKKKRSLLDKLKEQTNKLFSTDFGDNEI